MKLADLIKKGSLQRVATATVATSATHGVEMGGTVATVATVAVANSPKQAVSATPRRPLEWLIGAKPVDPSVLTARLHDAAMRACDHYGDGPEARDAMAQSIRETPEHLRADLLEHYGFSRSQEPAAPAVPAVLVVDPAPPSDPSPDPAQWRELAQAYHRHHFGCHQCRAAGRGSGYGLRCGAGAALWLAYDEEASSEPPEPG